MILVLVSLAALGLAYANGANDNSKGVATLFGTGTASYRGALAWATICTFAGSMTAISLAGRLVDTFRGQGLVDEAALLDPAFPMAVGLGAAATVMLATRFGLPVSTTHALTGALVGAGLASTGSVHLAALGSGFVVPLLVSPFVAFAGTLALYPMLHKCRIGLGVTRESCLCVGEQVQVIAREGIATAVACGPQVEVGTRAECFDRYRGRVAGIGAQTTLDRLHFLSAGAVSFARGINDTPKIAVLIFAGVALPRSMGLLLVGIAIALGGILHARRVTETMSHRITAMNHGQGFTANLVTAFLVIFASRWGLPVSTTHVSCGSLFGIGMATRLARRRTILGILSAWAITLPVAALLAMGVCLLTR
ncbi:MAG: inorganic phosphate transporter [Planctomycetes bacterium]|nr:inorganic phosphate transporter [Planctomycetota bacterium]